MGTSRSVYPGIAWPLSIWGEDALTRDMDLWEDIEWDEDKIAEVIKLWAERFHVDIQNFDLLFYYPTANLGKGEFTLLVLKAIFSAKARKAISHRALTLGMMEEAMIKGKWMQDYSSFAASPAALM